ncbi:protein indeterminate-domain 7-like isoform X1 [Syzygium oleosum]|uniref:protein indeterminate-domain 7-like isoform X1 n=1 Tax=Syzygium oleosum TaxID=219896 RepID=UPI0024B8A38F|nr:protein indeterminate-domain 7-like isoform X1 [Syzygium oleosum]
MEMKGLLAVNDNSMSNLTSTASGEICASSGSGSEIYGNTNNLYSHHSFASTNHQPPPPPKKKRSLPGNPDPDAEVIALSPRTLMATNRFICEICNKGFQRDQNLQLHRRGHNLPWKLKQRAKQEPIRKKVYVCPEPTCVHHDPSRALGDLTGIKKHFFRKHGEKKWKCDKCSKRYAVRSDWKAHSKVCGTKEYRCDCGTLFSRRDSFITHRAFCDALAEEGAKATPSNPPNFLISSSQPPTTSLITSHINLQNVSSLSIKREQEQQQHQQVHIFNPRQEIIGPLWTPPPYSSHGTLSSPSSLFDPSPQVLENPNSDNPSSGIRISLPHAQNTVSTFCSSSSSPHMSATALLQKAAQMGVAMSNQPGSSLGIDCRTPQTHSRMHDNNLVNLGSRDHLRHRPQDHQMGTSRFVDQGLSSFGNKAVVTPAGVSGGADEPGPLALLQQDMNAMMMMHPLSSLDGADDDLSEMILNNDYNNDISERPSSDLGGDVYKEAATLESAKRFRLEGNKDHMATRDFLGLRAFSPKDFLKHKVAGFDPMD